jgi:hypothetical protein
VKNLIKLISKEIANQNETVLNNRETEMIVSFLIQGQAILKKGENYEQVCNFAIPWDKITLLLLSKLNGVTVQSVLKEVLNSEVDTTEIKLQATEAMKEIKGNSVRKYSGKVTVKAEQVLLSEIDVCEYC